jgi:hypothetical protein
LFTLTVYQRLRPEQKVGILARLRDSGKVEVIEYSEAGPGVMEATDEEGLVFDCGHVNTNCFDLSAIGEPVPPTIYTNKPLMVGESSIKSSTFEVLNQHITRMLPGTSVGVFAGDQDKYFLPTKNMEGPDSVQTTREFLSETGVSMLKNAGAIIHGRGQTVDISPLMEEHEISRLFKHLELFDHTKIYLSPVQGPGFSNKVITRKQGTLILDVLEPFGSFTAGPNRKVTQNLPAPILDVAGQVEIGKGATLILRMRAGSVFKTAKTLKVSDGKTLKIELGQGETRNSWR